MENPATDEKSDKAQKNLTKSSLAQSSSEPPTLETPATATYNNILAYTPNYLEQHIAGRNKFSGAVRRKEATVNRFEMQFHTTVRNMMIAVKEFRLEPRRFKSDIIYTFQNDANINYISEQLLTIDEFGVTNKEQMYAKAEELKAANDTAGLKRVKELIKAYESIVEGNCIENLIRTQKNGKRREIDKRTCQKISVNFSPIHSSASNGYKQNCPPICQLTDFFVV